MNWKTRILAVAMGAVGATVLAQDPGSSAQSTSQSQTTTTTTTRTATGSVVQYTPGQTIVVRGADGKLSTYSIGSGVDVPTGVQVGKTVTLSTQPSPDGSGSTVVTRVETTTVKPQGSSGSESSSMSSSGQSANPPAESQTMEQRTETTTRMSSGISGKVTAYQPQQSITLDEPGKGPVTYVIDAQSDLPQDIAIGKTVTITTRTVQGFLPARGAHGDDPDGQDDDRNAPAVAERFSDSGRTRRGRSVPFSFWSVRTADPLRSPHSGREEDRHRCGGDRHFSPVAR